MVFTYMFPVRQFDRILFFNKPIISSQREWCQHDLQYSAINYIDLQFTYLL